MKKTIWMVIPIILVVSLYYSMLSNPIVVQCFNELSFTQLGWILEIKSSYQNNTNGWYIISNQDTAHLKYMEIGVYTTYLITQDSLLGPLHIDPHGDDLRLYSLEGFQIGFLRFGASANITAPKTGQSICKGFDNWYIDNTPTLGYENDTINATGHIVAWVKDEKGFPFSNVQVAYRVYKCTLDAFGYNCSWWYDTTLTNSDGSITISSLSIQQWISFNLQNYNRQFYSVQVFPESTVTMNIVMSPIVSVERNESQIFPKDFSISEPFPNPFNPETQILYTLPRNDNVQIDVFEISGKCVDKIFSGYQSAGSYRAQWNAIRFPSGIYIIRIQAGEVVLSKKCALVK